jgi:hypothetical protein
MATYSKTAGSSLFTLQSIASAAVATDGTFDVSAMIAAMVYIRFGRRAATALTVGTIMRLEASSEASGDRYWHSYATLTSDIAAAADEAVNGTCSAGQNVVGMASTTGFTVGSVVFMDNSTIGNSEWGRIKVVTTNTSVTLEDNLTNAQTGATVYGQGQIFRPIPVDCRFLSRIRLVADNTGTGQAVAVVARVSSADSFGT